MRPYVLKTFAFLLLLGGLTFQARAEGEPSGTLRVVVTDDGGSLVDLSHLYIFSSNKKKFYGTRDATGITTFDLPSGDYHLYAGRTQNVNGIFDHYSSPEVIVAVSSAEPTTVILSLQKADDSEMTLSDRARQKLGIDDELAKYLN